MPKAVRGYGAIVDEQGRLIGSAQQLKPQDTLTVLLKDGQAECTVKEVRRGPYGAEKKADL